MRIRTSLSIVVLVVASIAVPVYFVPEPDRPGDPTEISDGGAPPEAGDVDAQELYCALRTPANGVVVTTGADCSRQGEPAGPDLLTLTITREPEALVITGSDP
jgi:hypothetical protein